MHFLAAAALAGLSAAQVRYPARPPQGEFILDEAKLIKAEHAAEIRGIAGDVVAKKDAPIVVVTIKSLADYGAGGWPIPRYAMNLFAEWSVGRAEWNYGILLLVSTGDRKARIELGAAWGHLKDPEAQRIMNERIVPRFKAGDFSGGILEGVKGLRDLALGIAGTPTPRTYGGPPRRDPDVPAPAAPYRPPYEPPFRNIGPTGSTSSWLGPIVFGILAVAGVSLIVSLLRRGSASSWGPGYAPGLSSGCMPLGAGCLGAGLGNMFFGGRSHYWDDPWHPRGGGWLSRGRGSWGSGGGSSWSSDSGSGSWGGGDSGGGFSGGGGATGEW
jgi:uncharacterized membrane protein YgcG